MGFNDHASWNGCGVRDIIQFLNIIVNENQKLGATGLGQIGFLIPSSSNVYEKVEKTIE